MNENIFSIFIILLLTNYFIAHSEPARPINVNTNDTITENGYVGIVEIGYAIDTRGDERSHPRLNFINGYQINPYFSLGLGTGVRKYSFRRYNLIVPLVLDLRFNFLNKSQSPYLSFGGGYSFNASNDFDELGQVYYVNFGGKFKGGSKTLILLGTNYEFQELLFDNLKTIGLNFGFLF